MKVGIKTTAICPYCGGEVSVLAKHNVIHGVLSPGVVRDIVLCAEEDQGCNKYFAIESTNCEVITPRKIEGE